VEDRPEPHDPYDITAPGYGPAAVEVALAAVAVVVTLLAVLVADLAWVWRAVAVAAVVATAILIVNVWFASRWLWSQWRRARLYPQLLSAKGHLERELATLHGMRILAAGLPRLDVDGLYEDDGRLVVVVGTADGSSMQRGETLLVVDILKRKLVGRARVVALEPSRCEAEVYESLDALFWGFVHQEIRRCGRCVPADTAVFREADDLARRQAIARLRQEVQE